MTENEFKTELVADLQFQLQRKGKNFTSESWYLSDYLYPLRHSLKKRAIAQLIQDGIISRISITRNGVSFHALALCLAPAAQRFSNQI